MSPCPPAFVSGGSLGGGGAATGAYDGDGTGGEGPSKTIKVGRCRLNPG